MKSIIFICEGDELSQSTSHRCYMVANELVENGYSIKILPNSHIMRKEMHNIIQQFKNWVMILKENPDIVVIHRVANLIDYHMIKFAKKSKIIFDYDDALFHIRYPGRILSYSHLNKILEMSDAVSAGSHYLLEFAKQFNKNVFLIPTPVDMEMFHPVENKKRNNNQIVIGWLGSGTKYQLRYLRLLKDPLKKLVQKYDIKFKIISALAKEVRDEFAYLGSKVDFGLDHWVPLEEIPMIVSDFDIGVMPLTDEPFARGKCAMKALEYMAMGIPVVASAVGENKYVIENGQNGFLVYSPEDWIRYLEKLILDRNLREKIGKNGRRIVEEKYSVKVVADKIIDIIEEI